MDYIFRQSIFGRHRHSGADQILTDFYVSVILSDKEGKELYKTENIEKFRSIYHSY